MAIPVNAYVFDEEMDPGDRVDYLVEGRADRPAPFVPMLEPTETITSFSVTRGAESVLAGLVIDTASGRAPSIVGGTAIKFWLLVDQASQNSPLFSQVAQLPLLVQIVTSKARTIERTVVVKVANQ